MKLQPAVFGALVAALLVTGCDQRKDQRPPPPEPKSAAAAPVAQAGDGENHLPPGIDWFGGDVDAAFAAAKAANKPVFLYWGAEWCPPCAQIKTTIFSKREFQDRSRLFVPVYLDGDTPGAQKHGERFIWINPPAIPLSTEEMDSVFALPYKRVPHPAYGNARIPAYEMIRFSINIMRGCFGGCSFTLVFMYLELNSTFLFLEFKLFIVIERYPFNVQQAC